MDPFSFGQICPLIYTVQPGDSLFLIAQRYGTTVQEIISANPGVDISRLYVGQNICIWPGGMTSQTQNGLNSNCITSAEMDLSNHMRLLWEQHITWTRLAIISMVFDLPDADLVIERLLRNPQDFAAALLPIYGASASSRFADLLTAHLVIASQLVKAAKAGDSRLAAETERKWYDNARDIAALLGSINPYWSVRGWEQMLFAHLALVKSEAVDMLNKNYQAEINLYDEMERQAMMMADELSRGIIKQFPARFR